MKLSIMSYTLAVQGWQKNGKFDVEGMCKLAKKIGLEGVDMVTTYGINPKEIRKILSDYALPCVAYTFFANLNAYTSIERIKGIDQVRLGIEVACELGAPIVMIPSPGDNKPRDITRKNYIRALQESAVFAKNASITMTIENFPGANTPFGTSSDILEAIREVPSLRLTFDNGNVFVAGEDPAVSIERCKDYIVHSHFKDWLEDENGMQHLNGKRYIPALIGEGVVNHKDCIKAFRKIGYKGFINIEYESNKIPVAQAVEKAAKYLNQLINDCSKDML